MNNKGFTLMEVLISIVILTMISVMIAVTFNVSIKVWERGDKDMEFNQQMRIFTQKIREHIKGIYPYIIKDKDFKKINFYGEEKNLEFVTTSEKYKGGLILVSYIVSDNGLLIEERDPFIKKDENDIPKGKESINLKFKNAGFRYFHSEKKEWESLWKHKDKLPTAIEINADDFKPIVISVPSGGEYKKSRW